jgi:hypothetical protein
MGTMPAALMYLPQFGLTLTHMQVAILTTCYHPYSEAAARGAETIKKCPARDEPADKNKDAFCYLKRAFGCVIDVCTDTHTHIYVVRK